MKNWYWYLLFLVPFFGCKSVPQPQTQHQVTRTIKDSVATRSETVDSLLILRKADSVSLRAVLQQLGETPITKQSGSVTASLSKVGQEVICDCHTEELNQIIQLQKEFIEHYQKEHVLEESHTTHIEKEMPGWAKPFLYLGIAMTIGIFGLAILYIIKLKGKII